jgi:hypothetical protein
MFFYVFNNRIEKFMRVKLKKEKVADILIVVVAWAIALSLLFMAYTKYRMVHHYIG